MYGSSLINLAVTSNKSIRNLLLPATSIADIWRGPRSTCAMHLQRDVRYYLHNKLGKRRVLAL